MAFFTTTTVPEGHLRFGSIDVPVFETDGPISGAVFPQRKASPAVSDAESRSAPHEPQSDEAIAATDLLDSLDGRL